MQKEKREAAFELKGCGSHVLHKTHNQLQEDDLGGPTLGLSSCFSTRLAAASSLLSAAALIGGPIPTLTLPATPTLWCQREEPRVLACDHRHRCSPASMHRHNAEALAGPQRLAEKLQRAAGICTSHEFTQQRSNRWCFVLFPGPGASPLVTFSGGSLGSGGGDYLDNRLKWGVGGRSA